MAKRKMVTFAGEDEIALAKWKFLDEGDADDLMASLTTYSIDDVGDVRLAREVLKQAAMDADLPQNNYVRTCARAYLTNASEGLAQICLMARISMSYLIETWTKHLGGVTPFPENYEVLFKRDLKWKKENHEDETRVSSRIHFDRPSGDFRMAARSLAEAFLPA